MSERNSPVIGRTAALVLALAMSAAPSVARAQSASQPAVRGLGVAAAGDEAPEPGFMERQLEFARVRAARDDIRGGLVAEFRSRKIAFPPSGIFLRVFKRERIVELWVRPAGTERYTLFRSYPMCVLSGGLGPKRAVGDYQVPEGFYHLTYFNPSSEYLLSLGISYPNRADSLRTADSPPGGDIFIHGGCKTIGCVPMTDEQIREIYWMAVEARTAGQRVIPVHIFPTRLDPPGLAWLERQYADRPDLSGFWRNLQKGYLIFEQTHRLTPVAADAQGLYVFGREAALELLAQRQRAVHRPGAPKLVGRPVDAPPALDEPGPPVPTPAEVPLRAGATIPLAAPAAEESLVSSPAPDVRSVAPAPGAPDPPLAGRPLDAAIPNPAVPAAVDPVADPAAAGAAHSAARNDGPGGAAAAPPQTPLAGRPAPFQNRPLEHGLIQKPADGSGAAAAVPADSAPTARRTGRRGAKKPPPLLGRPAEAAPDSTGAGGDRVR